MTYHGINWKHSVEHITVEMLPSVRAFYHHPLLTGLCLTRTAVVMEISGGFYLSCLFLSLFIQRGE
jgi:hypothetical protein